VNVIRTDVERVERYCKEHVYTVNKRVSISEKTGDLNSAKIISINNNMYSRKLTRKVIRLLGEVGALSA